MNIERLKSLLEFLKALPEEQFDYSVYKVDKDCGTIGCVAGWCAVQNGLDTTIIRPVEEFLELSESEAYFLFWAFCDYAKKSDAIKRLEWLIEHGTTAGYPVYKESWNLSEDETWVNAANAVYGLELNLGE